MIHIVAHRTKSSCT